MPLSPGQRIGPYEIVAPLGEGGMGQVYRAFDARLRRHVAVKILSSSADSLDAHQRLLAEARSASALNHPNICTIYDVGGTAEIAFIAMELIDGVSLAKRLEDGPLPIADVVRIGSQVADALAHAHRVGLIHRDLKIANVMLTAEGLAKVVDFGLAQRTIADTAATTAEGGPAAAGTLYSMAPEQLRGEPLDARCDVWAIGVLLHEMLTASHPFAGANAFVLADAILRNEPAPLPVAIPAPLRAIVARCLARDRAHRFHQGGEVRAALEAFGSVVADAAAPPSEATPTASNLLGRPPALERREHETTFVGRSAEWSTLEDAWRETNEGHRQLVVISGEPGIGKTRLAAELGHRALDAGGAALFGRCDEEALIAYQPFVEAIDQYLALASDHTLRADLHAAPYLVALQPSIATRLSLPPLPPTAGADGLRYRMFESVVALLTSVTSRQPLVLLLDDLQWADKPTLLLLRHLVRVPQHLRLCIVGTYRDTELSAKSPLGEFLTDLHRERGVRRISLQGVDRAAVSQMADRWLPGANRALITRVHSETAGNPFFVTEVLAHLKDSGLPSTESDGYQW